MLFPKETLELIQTTAQKAQTAAVIDKLNTDGRKAYVQQGGEIKQFDLPPANREHVVHTLADLILYAARPDNPAPVVWHDESGVQLLINDADRRDSVVFTLSHSKRFDTLRYLADEKPMFDQAAFVRLLRIDLGLDNLKIVSKFRKLDWSQGNDAAGDVQHGNNKVSKSIIAKVQGIDELPDVLAVEVPVYQQTGERQAYVVQCAIELDTINQRLQLVPLPDEIERVVDLAQDSIRQRLATALKALEPKKEIPVYYGQP